MANIIKSFLNMYRHEEAEEALKTIEVNFSVFTPDVISIEKVCDKPNDYYFPEDTITFIITLKNLGDKNITGFCLKDDSVRILDPMPNGYYEVLTPVGEVSFNLDEVVISNISLESGSSLEIRISGMVKKANHDTNHDLDTF